MLALLPIACFCLLWVLLSRCGVPGRRAFLWASLISAGYLVLLVEALSLFNALALPGIALGWGAAAALLVFLNFRAPARPRWQFPRLAPALWLLLGASAVIIVITAVIAFLAPPNNWDSMTFHMSRAAHWIQNQSVANFPTGNLRQLYESPGAEFAITTLQILSGGDRLANFVQWFSMLGSLVAVSLITQVLGASRRGQVYAIAICVTIPMLILQSTSTQTDLTVAFWMSCVAFFCVDAHKNGLRRETILGIGLAAGLALITKATSYIYLFPFAVWFGILVLRQFRSARVWKAVLLASVLIVLLNAGHVIRNFQAFGSATGPEAHLYLNDAITPGYFLSNLVRNVALEFAVSPDLNERFRVSERMNRYVGQFHDIIGVAMSDPATTWAFADTVAFSPIQYNEDYVAAPAHVLLGILVIGIFALRYRSFRGTGLITYLGAVAAGFFLFSLLLKFQPWHNRLHLPLLVMFAPFAAYVLERTLPSAVSNVLIAALLLLATTPLFNNVRRPLLGEQTVLNTDRWAQYFFPRSDIRQAYTDVMPVLQSYDCSDIGLYLSGDSWEYPLWVAAHEHFASFRFEHFNSPILATTMQPCAIIREHRFYQTTDNLNINGQTFVSVWLEDPLEVLVPQ